MDCLRLEDFFQFNFYVFVEMHSLNMYEDMEEDSGRLLCF